MEYVYVVMWGVAYEGDKLLGVFSDYVKARDFEVNWRGRHAVDNDEYEWVEVRKVELNKVYSGFDNVGEVL